ncbi:MAG: chemotaxis protein CheW [Magnetococcales bacterium]|nr:chemotaxis protein CheW [Magnetococcales bacterium]
MPEQPNHNGAQQSGSDYLIVGLTDTLYGVEARLVREVVRLPEVTPMEDAPHFIVGVINLRGRVVPVLDLNMRLGRLPQESYLLSDSVVVLEQAAQPEGQGPLLGLLVNEIREIVALQAADWEATPVFEEFARTGGSGHEAGGRRYRFVEGVAKVGEDLVMLLAIEHLLHVHPSDWGGENGEEGADPTETLTARRRFNPQGSESTQKLFHERARRLRQRLDQQDQAEKVSLAIVRLHGELLGVNLHGVTGFAKVAKVTPIPCCPPHIAGGMNLRGEVLILVDLRHVLDLPTSGQDLMPEKALVVPLGTHAVGVLVHDVVDVIHVQAGEIAATPAAASTLRGEHLQGAVPYQQQMLGILNVQAILADSALLVNEEV